MRNYQWRSLLILGLAFVSLHASRAQSLSIMEAYGWFESAVVKWLPEQEAEGYHVYIDGVDLINHKIDNQLIRSYGSYYRADVPGLKPGNYTLTIKPVMSNEEGSGSTTEIIPVSGYDRSGFAFSNGHVPGAYQSDGALKPNAVVIYVTQNTKDNDSLDVTGANSNPCIGLQGILDGYKKGIDTRPLAIRVIGQITDPSYLIKGDIVIENKNNTSSHITIEGIGEDATIDGWGIRVKNAVNIEIRNLGLMNTDSDEGDNIGLQQNNSHIWVHHCDFFYGSAGGDADQSKGDGALDCKKSTYVTFSFNHFWDTGKTHLLGLGENTTEGYYVTYHHNWFDHSDSRHPRVRFYSAHVYNNYYDGNAKYGVGSTEGSSVFVEGNYFRNCKYPMLISMQGSDVFDESQGVNDYVDMPTFSKEDGGIIKYFNNYIEGARRFVAYGDPDFANSLVDFDAVVVDERGEGIERGVTSVYGANAYNNFDTEAPEVLDVTPDDPQTARDRVMEFSGRMNGGDFQWNFNNAVDDSSYEVNQDLKNALINYETALVSVQDDGDGTGGGGDGGGEGGSIDADIVHNFTVSGLTSDYFVIQGNLSDSKGTFNYDGLTLSQCLKIESSTLITFSTSENALLRLVFNHGFSGSIKIDGISHSATDGILDVALEKGDHNITKDHVANLYLISLDFESDDEEPDLILSVSGNVGFDFYPNPFEDICHIYTTTPIRSIFIYHLNGQLALSSKKARDNIDLGALQKGAYILLVRTDGGQSSRMIFKK